LEILQEFDELARKALEARKLRYEEWKARKPKLVPPTAKLLSKLRNPPAPTERTMLDAYNFAGQRSTTLLRLAIPSDPSQIPKTWTSGNV
jgi:hypothetical protein